MVPSSVHRGESVGRGPASIRAGRRQPSTWSIITRLPGRRHHVRMMSASSGPMASFAVIGVDGRSTIRCEVSCRVHFGVAVASGATRAIIICDGCGRRSVNIVTSLLCAMILLSLSNRQVRLSGKICVSRCASAAGVRRKGSFERRTQPCMRIGPSATRDAR